MAWRVKMLGALFALLAQESFAQRNRGSDFLRFSCSQLVIERADPIVQPGTYPSAHMHQIVGGDSFNITV